jgi:hypothetical protein
MPAPKKITKPIVRFDHRAYVFDSLSAAADAIKFFGKLRAVKFEEDPSTGRYHYPPLDDEDKYSIELETDREFRATPNRMALPAPKRGTVPCTMCESVSVRPGSACESCGTIAPLL